MASLIHPSTSGMLLFLICATITGQQYTAKDVVGIGYANIVFVWLHGVAYALAWSGLLVAYTVEILPYKLRAKGVFIMNLSVQVALTINNYVNPIPISEGGGWYGQNWKLFACYCGWILLELIWVYFFYVETRYVHRLQSSPYLPTRSLTIFPAAPPSRRLRASSTARAPRSPRSTSSARRAWPSATTATPTTRRRCTTTTSRRRGRWLAVSNRCTSRFAPDLLPSFSLVDSWSAEVAEGEDRSSCT